MQKLEFSVLCHFRQLGLVKRTGVCVCVRVCLCKENIPCHARKGPYLRVYLVSCLRALLFPLAVLRSEDAFVCLSCQGSLARVCVWAPRESTSFSCRDLWTHKLHFRLRRRRFSMGVCVCVVGKGTAFFFPLQSFEVKTLPYVSAVRDRW